MAMLCALAATATRIDTAIGRTKEGEQSKKKSGKASGWALEIRPKHRKSLPNGRQQAPPQGGDASRRPLGVLVVFHLVRISYAFASFLEPVLVRFLTKFADSESSPADSDSFPVDSVSFPRGLPKESSCTLLIISMIHQIPVQPPPQNSVWNTSGLMA